MTPIIKNVTAIVATLDARSDVSDAELDRVFRALAKKTHPDIQGGDEAAFRYLTEAFSALRQKITATREHKKLLSDIDPLQIANEMGWGKSLTDRANLFVCLDRFCSLGLHRHRARSRIAAKRELVVRSILFWALLYDRTFAPIFDAFLRHQSDYSITDNSAKRYFFARRVMMRGIVWFLRYQESGRAGAATIARDSLTYVVNHKFASLSPELHELSEFATWFLHELSKKPERYGAPAASRWE